VKFRGETRPLQTISERRSTTRSGELDIQARIEAAITLNEQVAQTDGGESSRWSRVPFPPIGPSLPQDLSGRGVLRSFEGLNSFDNVWSSNGNQLASEPSDLGLCVGNGYELETVNSVIQVYDPSGVPQIIGQPFFPQGPPVGLSLNEFFGFPPTNDQAFMDFAEAAVIAGPPTAPVFVAGVGGRSNMSTARDNKRLPTTARDNKRKPPTLRPNRR
jgi:hypothetical protein